MWQKCRFPKPWLLGTKNRMPLVWWRTEAYNVTFIILEWMRSVPGSPFRVKPVRKQPWKIFLHKANEIAFQLFFFFKIFNWVCVLGKCRVLYTARKKWRFCFFPSSVIMLTTMILVIITKDNNKKRGTCSYRTYKAEQSIVCWVQEVSWKILVRNC